MTNGGVLRAPRAARLRRLGGALVACGLLVGGCASMPGSGPVQRVESDRRADADSQVRVFGVSPQPGALPQDIARGFLEAITSDEADFATAREYLTPEAAEDWDPMASTTVLADGPLLAGRPADPAIDGSGFAFEISGTRLAVVDAGHVYEPEEGVYRERLSLRQVDDEWRIDRLPDGLVLGESDFRRIHRGVNRYYYADAGPEASLVPGASGVLVADPIQVRSRVDPVGEAVAALIDGPSPWLEPVVTTHFPEDARLVGDSRPAPDESGVLTLRLGGLPADLGRTRCERMAAQTLHTVRGVGAAEVTEVRLASRAGRDLCSLTALEAQTRAPGLLIGSQERQYLLDEERRLVAIEDEGQPRPVAGPLGREGVEPRAVAVRRDEEVAAAVSADGATLWVTELTGNADLPDEPLYVSAGNGAAPPTAPSEEGAGEDDPAAGDGAEGPAGSEGAEDPEGVDTPLAAPTGGLTTPSWDGLGDLWFADRDAEAVSGGTGALYRLPRGGAAPEEVEVRGLRSGQRLEALRVSSDGTRVAMLISQRDRTALYLGRIERSAGTAEEAADPGDAVGNGAGDDGTAVVVDGLRPIAPHLQNVVAVSWAGAGRLVVAGRPEGGVDQIQYVGVDGSTAPTAPVPGLSDVTGVAASEREDRPLLAESADGVARLQQQDAQWKVVMADGTGPVYPG
ncbi:LpqB family beta-propeller domain-containing protein [Streptomyces sp. ST2-7A]|uniref:LpqB family beta-propeller domain-containing protein n=1 Tax=Streptomyces sp. ST2-7A TaxID=2907214 RepID=UPI001F18F66F|nr:LpqB family beta-propeller domain-containing protein [Streptomyces sp. ST2-7A]MCE7082378.1 LpqB family beta-propeller domain-containing protein [Streptomyces sp. ST2-7A]